jgi:Sulfate permease and related transporters (MFS superfamily)
LQFNVNKPSRANSFLSGFLIDFISGPVSVGFTSAAAIIIATSQVKDILGLDFTAGKFLLVWQKIFEHIGETRLWDAVLGVVCMIVLLLLRVSRHTNNHRRLHRAILTQHF